MIKNSYDIIFATRTLFPQDENTNPDDYEQLVIYVIPRTHGIPRTSALLTVKLLSDVYQKQFRKLDKFKLIVADKKAYTFNKGTEDEIEIIIPTPSSYKKHLKKIFKRVLKDIKSDFT